MHLLLFTYIHCISFQQDYTELSWSEQYTRNKHSFQSLFEHFLLEHIKIKLKHAWFHSLILIYEDIIYTVLNMQTC
jgi:hypothetical protein